MAPAHVDFARALARLAAVLAFLSVPARDCLNITQINLVDSIESNDFTGLALATGDFNKDGRADLVISAPGESINLGGGDNVPLAGAVVVVYGTIDGLIPALTVRISAPSPFPHGLYGVALSK